MGLTMYYENTIYPLQDKILSIIDSLNTSFYLTGGTALSRFYFNHRYSDDIALFVNNDNNFQDYLKFILQAIAGHNIKYIVEKKDESFCRLTIENILKVDFVNDVPAYYGSIMIKTTGPYSKIDNPMNILANKITAFFDRGEPKDISDIWIISKNITIDWKEILTAVNSKAAGLNAPLLAKKIDEFDVVALEKIKWIKKFSIEEFKKDKENIINGILKIK